MKVEVIEEYGYCAAMLGLGLSYGVTSDIDYESFSIAYSCLNDTSDTKTSAFLKTQRRADMLAGMGDGHDKFLRMMSVWLDIDAPMYWWKQFDTYKVGTTAQSESTMHTLMKKPLTQDDFEGGINTDLLKMLNAYIEEQRFDDVNRELPMSFLQRRIVATNYAVLQNIYNQRSEHKLIEWRHFCRKVVNGVEYPHFITH